MAKKKNTSYSRIFEQFAGDYITISLKSLRSNPKNKAIANVMMAGYLLDECEEFYYIGETVNEIFAAIRKSEVNAMILGGGETDIELPKGTELQ